VIVAGNADVGEPDVCGTLSVTAAGGRQVLKEFNPGPVVRKRQMRHAHMRAGLADDFVQISAGLLLLERHAHAHRIPPEPQRPVEVSDREVSVVQHWHPRLPFRT
jgi:hypothetical protein